ncbi:MAG TPA: hypothetical protein VL979_06315 [Solirubrobacteraceae bacterium]|nr:hypothetical protein [Solirubrobacteraceae bacterium]
MRRITITGLTLVIVLAVSATVASTASASKLILSEYGTALSTGQLFGLFGRENFAVSSDNGLECGTPEYEEMEVYATLVSNSARKDVVDFNEEEYDETQVGPCESDGGNALVFWRSGGESLWLGANGKASMRGVSIGVAFERLYQKGGRPEGEEVECNYFTKALHGTNTATPTRQPLTVSLSGTLKRSDSPGGCARTLHASFSFPDIETYEGTIEEEI